MCRCSEQCADLLIGVALLKMFCGALFAQRGFRQYTPFEGAESDPGLPPDYRKPAEFVAIASLPPDMCERDWGRIVFISRESGLQIPPGSIAYGAVKAAVIATARGLRPPTSIIQRFGSPDEVAALIVYNRQGTGVSNEGNGVEGGCGVVKSVF